MSVEIGKLSFGERLFVHRAKRGWTQDEAAEHWGVSVHHYREAENLDKVVIPKRVPDIKVSEVAVQIRLQILRRRSGMTIAEAAKAVGCSPAELRRMELGEADPRALAEYWRTNDTVS